MRVAGNPVELMGTVLLTLTDKVEALFNVLSLLASLPFLAIWTVVSLLIMRMAGMDGRC